ncbi:MAG TPA: type II secretion system protein [Candidatus Saccharimonadales bacterium]|nr:type II secretion system protein [Candidatus Saccharimonadales bacterium]
MKNLLRKKGQSGFTIIEVTIVLAIAGLIMAIVFVAVPALERSARNTQRKNDASNLSGLVSEYASNHAGVLPAQYSDMSSLTSGQHWSIMDTTPTLTSTIPGSGGAYGSTTQLVIYKGATCDPQTGAITSNPSDRSFAIGYQIETTGDPENACAGD